MAAPCTLFCCRGTPSFPRTGVCSQELAWILCSKLGRQGTLLQMLSVV